MSSAYVFFANFLRDWSVNGSALPLVVEKVFRFPTGRWGHAVKTEVSRRWELCSDAFS